MSSNCPKCRQMLPDSTVAKFCMFCGQPLSSTSSNDAPTIDFPTQAFIPNGSYGSPDSTPTPLTVDSLPARISKFRLVKPLGEGGMGRVYEAEDEDSGEHVAIKLLSAKLTGSVNSVERFRQEGRLASQISHPRCVFVLGADTDAGRPFIVMELMPGRTLRDIVDQDGPLAPEVAIHHILDVVDGLIEAHRLGVIHRDVKPSNCFLADDGRVKVGDFGLSKSLAADLEKSLTTSGTFLGTVLYASPEQIRGETVGYDSDVYSVCATMYFLLTGRAPFEHVSLTAALAKAISEPPPSIRKTHPKVPRVLENIILKGLERDRTRRWGSLEELRDALTELLPEKLVPARARLQLSAYLVDAVLLLLCVSLPLEIMEHVSKFSVSPKLGPNGMFEPLPWVLYLLYFALLEWRFGFTPGKWMLGLRVIRTGQIGAPTFLRALGRASIFILLEIGLIESPSMLGRKNTAGLFLTSEVFLVCLILLSLKFFSRWSYRGLHDMLTGCQVMQRPLRGAPIQLQSKLPSPLESTDRTNLPAALGGFDVRGKVCELPQGEMVWVADDRSLGRRVLVWLRPYVQVDDGESAIPVRQTRLRLVNSGIVTWQEKDYYWQGFVAPNGSPITDLVQSHRQFPWYVVRPLLEQIIEELRCAEQEGTLPKQFSIDHLWVEPAGRIHLMEFPVPSSSQSCSESSASPMGFLREVTTLLLEGESRDSGGPVKAPLPPHAASLTNSLFLGKPSLEDLHESIAGSRIHPPRVTTSMRVTFVGLYTLLSAPGLILAVLTVIGFSLVITRDAMFSSHVCQMVVGVLEDGSIRNHQCSPRYAVYLAPDQIDRTHAQMVRWAEDTQRYSLQLQQHLSRPEKAMLEWTDNMERQFLNRLLHASTIERVIDAAVIHAQPIDEDTYRGTHFQVVLKVLGGVLLAFALFAFLFRGGFAYSFAGIAIVRKDGRPAGRIQCALREILVWSPVFLLLLTTLWVAAYEPTWISMRLGLSTTVLALLVGYAIVAIRYSHRGPHDRLVGTYLVPR